MEAVTTLSQKGATLILKSVTGAAYTKSSNRSKLPPPMTPSAKKVFHMMTSQDDKKDTVTQLSKRRDSVKHGIHQLSNQAIDSTWIINDDYVINPRSYVRKFWDCLLTLLVFYLISILPWELGVGFYHPPLGLERFDTFLGRICMFLVVCITLCMCLYAIEVVFWMDMVATLNTGFIHAGEVELDRQHIVEHYLSTWFLIDLVGNFPFYAFIGHRQGKTFKLLKWLKLNKLFRIGKLVRYLRDYVKFASLIKYLSVFLVFVHVTSCLATGEMFNHDDLHYITFWEMYYHALLAVLSIAIGGDISFNRITLGDTGSGIEVNTTVVDTHHRYLSGPSDTGHGFSFADRHISPQLTVSILVVGCFTLIFVTGAVMVLLSNRSNTTMKFKLKIENMKTELDYYDIDESLSARVMDFYDHLWFNQLNSDETSVHKDPILSAELRRELLLTIYSDMLISTPFLTACSEDCVANVANKLVNTIAMPTDYIVRKGDVGRELFIVKKGIVGVFNGAQFLKTLQKGQYFGEVALLNTQKKHRTATIRAISVTELCLLYAKDFHTISDEYPELLINMTQYMHATHLDADQVKNPKITARRRSTLDHGHGAAAGHRKSNVGVAGTPSDDKDLGKKGPMKSNQSFIGKVIEVATSPKSTSPTSGFEKSRAPSYGAQLVHLISKNFGDPKIRPAEMDMDDEDVPGMTRPPPSAEDVRKMISGLLQERLRTDDLMPMDAVREGEEEEENGSSSKDIDAKSSEQTNGNHKYSESQVSSVSGGSPRREEVVIPGSSTDIMNQLERIKDEGDDNAKAAAIDRLITQMKRDNVNKSPAENSESLRHMVSYLKNNLEVTNKQLEELSKVVILTTASTVPTAAAQDYAAVLHDSVSQLSSGRNSAPTINHRESEEHSTSRNRRHEGAMGEDGKYRNHDDKSVGRNKTSPNHSVQRHHNGSHAHEPLTKQNSKHKPTPLTHVHLHNHTTQYDNPSFDAKNVNQEQSDKFISEGEEGHIVHTGKGRSKHPSFRHLDEEVESPGGGFHRVPSVDSVDMHLMDAETEDDAALAAAIELSNRMKAQPPTTNNTGNAEGKHRSLFFGSSDTGDKASRFFDPTVLLNPVRNASRFFGTSSNSAYIQPSGSSSRNSPANPDATHAFKEVREG